MDGLPFVTGGIVTGQMRVGDRLRKNRPRSGRSGGKSSNAALRQLKKDVKSVPGILDFLDGLVEGPILDYFHASAAYTNLTEWKQIFTPSEKETSVLLRRRMTDHGKQAVALVLHRLGELSDDLEVPEGLLMALVKSLGKKPSGFDPERLSNSLSALWACAKLNFYHEELLVSVAQRAKSGDTLQTLDSFHLCRMLLSYGVLDPEDQFAEFKDTLESERLDRGLSDSDVSNVQLGYYEWQRAWFQRANEGMERALANFDWNQAKV